MATMSNEISTIAKNIKKMRRKKGISQDKLSKLAEIAYNTIIKIESGDYPKSNYRNCVENSKDL